MIFEDEKRLFKILESLLTYRFSLPRGRCQSRAWDSIMLHVLMEQGQNWDSLPLHGSFKNDLSEINCVDTLVREMRGKSVLIWFDCRHCKSHTKHIMRESVCLSQGLPRRLAY